MRRAFALAALLLLAQPVGAQAPLGPYEEAVAARQAGNPATAATLLRRLVGAEPGNADAQLQLGLSLLALGQLDEAEAAFGRTLAIAPAYADAQIGLARIAQRRGDSRRALALLGQVDPANREAVELRAALGTPGTGAQPIQLDLDLSWSELDGPAPDWREASLRVRVPASERTAITAAAELSRRFSRTDLYGELRVDQRVGRHDGIYVLVGATPDADFRPEWQVGAGGFLRLRDGGSPTILTLDARQAHFFAGDIQTVSPGVEQYFGERFWATARLINIFDERGDLETGWLLRGDVLATERLRFFAGAADAPDTSEGVVIETFSLFGGLSYDLNDRFAMRVSVAHEDRQTGADRLQLSLGVGTRF
jgi:YaiO family outer membrane protein